MPANDTEIADERWVPVQVAAFLEMTYQDARNAMLEGRFGAPDYDAKRRRLTVLASRVRDVRAQREKRREMRAKSRRAKRKH